MKHRSCGAPACAPCDIAAYGPRLVGFAAAERGGAGEGNVGRGSAMRHTIIF